ncbi:Uncharacterised protein [Vibrio cholerae]|nr:Uncharacterised protein [Vibrio cholerae]
MAIATTACCQPRASVSNPPAMRPVIPPNEFAAI